MNRSSETDVAAQLARYEELAVAWDSETNPRVANKLFGQLHAIALLMRHVEEGRFGLEALLDHPNRGVRLSAAGDCLAWGSEAAITGLESLVVPRDTHSLSAEMTLQEFRAGRMKFDW